MTAAQHTYDEVAERVAGYLAGGTRLVWLMYPQTRTVAVHACDGRARSRSLGSILDGGDVLPACTVPVGDLFP